jgi:hypothetical protein
VRKISLAPIRTDQLVTVIGYVCLTVTVGAVAAMSWTGLVGFAEHVLQLTGKVRYVVPLSLDGAALTCSFLALRSIIAGDAAAGPRALLWAFTCASAVANWYAATLVGTVPSALFFSGMSLASVALFEVVLRQMRRADLRKVGAVEAPLPRFRLLRWIRFPKETGAAWSLALRFGMTRPEDALVLHWEQTGAFAARTVESAGDPQTVLMETLRSATKAEALRIAFRELGCLDVMAAREWLKAKGIAPPSRAHAFAVKQQLTGEQTDVNRSDRALEVAW